MYKIDILNDASQFRDMRDEWNYLLSRSITDTIFLTWEWLFAWWTVFGKNGRLFIITVRNIDNELIGLAPLFLRKTKYYKFPIIELTLIGIGHSDRQDFIVSKESSGVTNALISEIYKKKQLWDILRIEQIFKKSALQCCSGLGDFPAEVEMASLCPYVTVAGDWEAFYKSLRKKFKKDIRHKINKLKKLGKWEFKVKSNNIGINEVTSLMYNVEMNSRKIISGTAFMQIKGNRDFIGKFIQLSNQRGWFDLSVISLANKPIAYLFGFIYKNKYYAYNMAYDKRYYLVSWKIIDKRKVKMVFF